MSGHVPRTTSVSGKPPICPSPGGSAIHTLPLPHLDNSPPQSLSPPLNPLALFPTPSFLYHLLVAANSSTCCSHSIFWWLQVRHLNTEQVGQVPQYLLVHPPVCHSTLPSVWLQISMAHLLSAHKYLGDFHFPPKFLQTKMTMYKGSWKVNQIQIAELLRGPSYVSSLNIGPYVCSPELSKGREKTQRKRRIFSFIPEESSGSCHLKAMRDSCQSTLILWYPWVK